MFLTNTGQLTLVKTFHFLARLCNIDLEFSTCSRVCSWSLATWETLFTLYCFDSFTKKNDRSTFSSQAKLSRVEVGICFIFFFNPRNDTIFIAQKWPHLLYYTPTLKMGGFRAKLVSSIVKITICYLRFWSLHNWKLIQFSVSCPSHS